MQAEAAGAGVDAAASFPEDPAEIIDQGGHPEQQIFTVDETDFSQKMLSMLDFHSKTGGVVAWLQGSTGQAESR